MDLRTKKKKCRIFSKTVRHLLKTWYLRKWDLSISQLHDEESGIAASTSMDDSYMSASMEINTVHGDTYGDIVEYARHETIHLTQSAFIGYFSHVEESVGRDNPLAKALLDSMARAAMEKAVVEVEMALNSAHATSIQGLCEILFKKNYDDPI